MNKQIVSRGTCRQCKAALPFHVDSCPMCGLKRPVFLELTVAERGFIETNKSLPAKAMDMYSVVEPDRSLVQNMVSGFSSHVGNLQESMMFWISFLAIFVGSLLHFGQGTFPLDFALFWSGSAGMAYDSIVLMRAVYQTHLFKRVTLSRGFAPYSVLFKLEKQLETFLVSLRSVTLSILERDWGKSSPELQSSADSFLMAIDVVSERVGKYADLSLEVASIIWRNNVYAILASNSEPQQKAIAIGNKCREAEALLLRHKWLLGLSQIIDPLKEHIMGQAPENKKNQSASSQILEKFNLTMFGPLEEGYSPSFETAPEEIPFKGRLFWHKRLPPFPLEDDGSLESGHHAAELLKSLKAVRPIKTRLEEQAAVNYVSKTISDVVPNINEFNSAIEAKQLSRDSVFEQFLDIPEFRTDPSSVNDEVDRLVAEARVALGTENIFDKE